MKQCFVPTFVCGKIPTARAKRARNKKLRRKFQVGDEITWGNGSVAHEIVQVLPDGVLVDVTSEKDARYFAMHRDGRYLLFVAFDKNNRNRSGRGLIRHLTKADLKSIQANKTLRSGGPGRYYGDGKE